MIPLYPPTPWHLTGFDTMLMYASVEDPDHARAGKIVRALRRESLRRGAKLNAAKTLRHMHGLRPRARLRVARQLVLEAPSAASYLGLVSAEVEAGNMESARSAACRMLSIAAQVGDLDDIETARLLVDRPSAVGEPSRERPDTFRDRLRRECGPNAVSYEAVQALSQEASGLGARATAIRCMHGLIRIAAHRSDLPAGVTFARELTRVEASSFSYLALGLAHERIGDMHDARSELARALRFACLEGDIHRATKATAGLVRTNGQDMVTRAELRWAMPEAKREPPQLPDYRFLLATLGLPGAA